MVTYAFPRPPPAPVITTVCPVNDRVMVLCELVKRKQDESVSGDVGTWEEAVRVKSNAGHPPGTGYVDARMCTNENLCHDLLPHYTNNYGKYYMAKELAVMGFVTVRQRN
jgi:hypothetical protein